MARFYWCKVCEDTHQRVSYVRNCDPEPPQRSDFPSPYVISDYLPGGVNGLYHHAACEKIDSKAAYRRATREHGCVEVGNEREALDKLDRESRNRELSSDVAEGAVNEALHRHGISSDSDMGNLDYGD